MIRTVTLRLEQDAYDELREAAAAERHPLSNFISTAALERVREAQSSTMRNGRDSERRCAGPEAAERFPAGPPAQERLRGVIVTGFAWSGTCVK